MIPDVLIAFRRPVLEYAVIACKKPLLGSGINMLTQLAKKVFGSRNDRLLKQYRKTVEKINALEAEMQALDDAALQAKTAEF